MESAGRDRQRPRRVGSWHRARHRRDRSASSSSRRVTRPSWTSAIGPAPSRAGRGDATRRNCRGSSSPEPPGTARSRRRARSSQAATRVVFGTLVAVGKPPEAERRRLDHDRYQLGPEVIGTRRGTPDCGSGSAPQLTERTARSARRPRRARGGRRCGTARECRPRRRGGGRRRPRAARRSARQAPQPAPGRACHAPAIVREVDPPGERVHQTTATAPARRPRWIPTGRTSTFAAKRWPP